MSVKVQEKFNFTLLCCWTVNFDTFNDWSGVFFSSICNNKKSCRINNYSHLGSKVYWTGRLQPDPISKIPIKVNSKRPEENYYPIVTQF